MKSFDQNITVPLSTYRVQLHKHFTLRDLEDQLDYLHKLGISAIYASPIFKATPGSVHGYDVTDPHMINPEIGDLSDLKRLSRKLKERDMLWIQDIVPNHMAFNVHNDRLMDVLERGKYSDYADYFDIVWDHPAPDLKEKVMVPFLGKSLEECIRGDEVKLSFSEQGIVVAYFENKYPLSISAYRYLLRESLGLPGEDGMDELLELATEAQDHNFAQWRRVKSAWVERVKNEESRLDHVNDVLAAINDKQSMLEEVLRHQFYALTHWKRTEKEISFRRFFTINSLICLRMEDKWVFQDYHSFLHQLYQQGIIDGLRIDHIDGLHNPNDYLKKLRNLFGDACYIVTEKILEATEDMPTHWPVQGDSGYQFLAQVSQLLTNRQGGEELKHFYEQMIPNVPDYERMVLENKQRILEQYMGGEWDNLTRHFIDRGLQNGFSYNGIKQALGGLMVCLPVYRIYPKALPPEAAYEKILNEAFQKAVDLFPYCKEEFGYLQQLFSTPSGNKAFTFLNRMMQFTGPLTAKGVEDTSFYVYNAHIAHCEVGDSPAVLGESVGDFHDKMIKKAERTPLTLNATATHDTKRGEDARIRLNVLSEMPQEWEEVVRQWIEMNKQFRAELKAKAAPTLNDEYFIYQSIIGGFPESLKVDDHFVVRLQEYIVKVTREAKVNSNWEAPDEEYEKACTFFIERVLRSDHSFLESVTPFVKEVMKYAEIYSLVQVLVKTSVPGVPDTYQGCALWDLSFVDPDNRRPVDYEKRRQLLDVLVQNEKKGFKALQRQLETYREGGIKKMYVLYKMLQLRKEYPKLFSMGSYHPLQVTSEASGMAFMRRYQDVSLLIVVPLGTRRHVADSTVALPEGTSGNWVNVFTGQHHDLLDQVAVDELFDSFPVAALLRAL